MGGGGGGGGGERERNVNGPEKSNLDRGESPGSR